LLLLLLATVIGVAADHSFGRAAGAWYPSGIAAAGDSLSTGYGSDGSGGDHPKNSWSIGENPAVGSHYARIRQRAPRIAGHTLLVARDGARASTLSPPSSRGLLRATTSTT